MAVHRRNVIKLASALVVALSLALSAPLLPAQSGKTEVLWLGQATFKITTPGGKVIVIDPFVTGNPKTPADLEDLAKRSGAKVFGPAGLVQSMIEIGWLTAEQGVRFGKGGKVQPLGPQITITQVRAEHSSDLVLLPIGGHFVMDPIDAAYATKEWLKPKFAIPIHYGTFPVLKGTPQEYMAALGQTTTKVFPINPGDRLEF